MCQASLHRVFFRNHNRNTDGHVVCDDPDDVDTCHGFLLAVYVNDLSGNKAQFFRRYQRERPEPVTILSNSDMESAQFLRHAHERLVEFHLYDNTEGGYTGAEATAAFRGVSPPPMGVLSTWNTAVPWAGGAWHSWTDLSNVDKAMAPLVDHNILVVNEAYSLLHGWAEGSIKNSDGMCSVIVVVNWWIVSSCSHTTRKCFRSSSEQVFRYSPSLEFHFYGSRTSRVANQLGRMYCCCT